MPTPAIDTARTEDELMERARRRVNMKMGFYVHATVFVLVNVGLVLINNITGGTRWSHSPLWGWGLGLAIHGIVTLIALRGDGLRDRMLADEMARLRSRE